MRTAEISRRLTSDSPDWGQPGAGYVAEVVSWGRVVHETTVHGSEDTATDSARQWARRNGYRVGND